MDIPASPTETHPNTHGRIRDDLNSPSVLSIESGQVEQVLSAQGTQRDAAKR